MGYNSTLSFESSSIPTLPNLSAPFYYSPSLTLIPSVPDKYTSLLLPIIIYWALSLIYLLIDNLQLPFTEKYRLHESKEVTSRNSVSAFKVAYMVILQQILQTVLGMVALSENQTEINMTLSDHFQKVILIHQRLSKWGLDYLPQGNGLGLLNLGLENGLASWIYWWGIPCFQFLWAFFIMDAWQYAMHRAFHENKFLYRNFHSHHHRLYVPYAYGALYNHPVEGLVLDSAGGALSHAAAFMTGRQGILLFSFATFKTVSDHSGYAFPFYLDPLSLVFPNTAEYHDVHHQSTGLKYNFSQPFFVHFDWVFGTKMGAEEFRRIGEEKLRKRKEREEKKLEVEKVEGEGEGQSSSVQKETIELRRRNKNEEEEESSGTEGSSHTIGKEKLEVDQVDLGRSSAGRVGS